MKNFFIVKTSSYEGPELGPNDTVSVEIQRYDVLGLIKSREKLAATVVRVETLVPTEPDRNHLNELIAMGGDETLNEKPILDFDEYPLDDPSDAGSLALDAQMEVDES